MRVRLTKQARRDVAQAAKWYEAKREGYTKLHGENRRCNLDQFPYALWFKIVDEIAVVGCLHGRRHTILAKERGRRCDKRPCE